MKLLSPEFSQAGAGRPPRMLAVALALALVGAAAVPLLDRGWTAYQTRRALDDAASPGRDARDTGSTETNAALSVPSYADVSGGVLASWQTIGGCGAGASTGSGGGVKWIGRGTTGGLFNVQLQTTYSRIASQPERPEHHVFNNALITKAVTDRWTLGVNIPIVYKYITDPYATQVDLSNSGLGDVSFLATRKFGPIGATSVTATVGVPTGEYKGQYKRKYLGQSQQRGFGKPTAALAIDHVGDEIWGLTTVGGTVSWRGGENEISNYRAPLASVYGHVGYFLGPLVPSAGLTFSGLTGHDRDQTVPQITGLYIASANVALEWSGDWFAVLLGASIPYQYDGIDEDTEGVARSPWGFGPWMVGMGLSFSPF